MVKPIVKWAGGKAALLPQYEPFLPKERLDLYVEPFLGGGAMFFHLQERFTEDAIVVLSDLNADLINMYRSVRDNLEETIGQLTILSDIHQADPQRQDKGAFYYSVRDEYNGDRGTLSPEQAARLIYLNKTCYNGLYRENSRGEMNVPKGKQKTVSIVDRPALEAVSKALNRPNVRLTRDIFQNTLFIASRQIKEGANSLFFVDPPYVPIEQKTNFSAYQSEGFGISDQQALVKELNSIAYQGATVLTSNSVAAIPLYKGWECQLIDVRRSISRTAEGRVVTQECLFSRGLKHGEL